MEVLWFWLILLLLFVAVAAAPWDYTRDRWPYREGGAYRYYPSAGALLAVVVILLLFWLGFIVIALPWAPVTAPPVVVD